MTNTKEPYIIVEDSSLTISLNGVDLPHGSGIDYDWTYTDNDDNSITCHNAYHTMDDAGGYCCRIPFDVTIKMLPIPENSTQSMAQLEVTDITVKTNDCELCDGAQYQLDEYLWSCFSQFDTEMKEYANACKL